MTRGPPHVGGETSSTDDQDKAGGLSIGAQRLIAVACGLLIANLYYAQPLTGLIGTSLGMAPGAVGLLVTLPLTGYGLGLLLIVPLGDRLENRRLVLVLVGAEALCLALMGAAPITTPTAFLALALASGAAAAAVQVLVPYATYLAPVDQRSRAVARAVSGLMVGILLARPVSSFVSDRTSWRAIFLISAFLMACLFGVIRIWLPRRRPPPGPAYGDLLTSMVRIVCQTEILRRRGLYHACMFGAFSVFWTAVPLWLTGPTFGLTQQGVAWVALAGVAGAIAPPIAGRVVDRGFSRPGTVVALLAAILAFAVTQAAPSRSWFGVLIVAAAAVILDFAVSANLVFGQRAIFALPPGQRSRLNGLYLAIFFVGGAVGSALSGWCYARFGWSGISVLGAVLPLLALVYLSTERPVRPNAPAEATESPSITSIGTCT